jgi:hypothetical protein
MISPSFAMVWEMSESVWTGRKRYGLLELMPAVPSWAS